MSKNPQKKLKNYRSLEAILIANKNKNKLPDKANTKETVLPSQPTPKASTFVNTKLYSENYFDCSLVRDELLHQIFEQTVQDYPKKIALICENLQLTYREVNNKANQLAHYLKKQGLTKGKFVGIYLPRHVDMYIAMLAILKTGAAYIPFDPAFPIDRIIYTLQDVNVFAIITHSSFIKHESETLTTKIIRIDQLKKNLLKLPTHFNSNEIITPDDTAYAICTSGTTGRPKCVEITHRAVCHFIRSEHLAFGVEENDIFYQGFSIAFDASLEEIWLTFLVGATLFVGTDEIVRSGPALAQTLAKANVTILSCVPTLLSMVEEDIPTIRQINFGGELCPAELFKRWHKPNRKIYNTYGPTEATVTTTWLLLSEDKPITIGKPLQNYYTYILDENLRPVKQGESGELYISGISLAKGYIGKPELTAQKFIANPFYLPELHNPIMYKTGDLARYTPEGEIDFLGRIDAQVKLRGFRIELSEIEAVLMECPEVKTAVSILKKDEQQIDKIVTFVVFKEGKSLPIDKLRVHAAGHLPPYMVPAIIQELKTLPTLASGKVNYKELALQPCVAIQREVIAPNNNTEQALLAHWQTLFPNMTISTQHNFFLDLGGHSLLAAKMISEMRQQEAYKNLSVLDVYHHPTIQMLANHIDTTLLKNASAEKKVHEPSTLSYYLCAFAQATSLYFMIGVYAFIGLFGPYLIFHSLSAMHYPFAVSMGTALAAFTILIPISLTLPILAKWLLIGRYKTGEYPLWGSFYFRWWLVNKLFAMAPTGYMVGGPFMAVYLRLCGAQIGQNVYLGEDEFDAFDLINIDDDTSIGKRSVLMNVKVEDGLLKIGSIQIGKHCFVGSSAVIEQNAVMEDHAVLEDLSLLSSGQVIPQHETWRGSPAHKDDHVNVATVAERPSLLKRVGFGLFQLAMIVIIPMIVMVPLFPAMLLLSYLNPSLDSFTFILYSPLLAISYIVLFCLEVTLIKWLLLGKIKAGSYPLYSPFYMAKWLFDQLMDFSMGIMHSLYATLYLVPWYRLLGIKLGKMSEVSSATVCPDVLQVADHSFIADGVYLGVQKVRGNQLIINNTHIGNFTFVGNSAVIPSGTEIGDKCLIGCLSTPPKKNATQTEMSWFGSPSFSLPARQVVDHFSDAEIYNPTKKLYFSRLIIEFFRVIFPLTCYSVLLIFMLALISNLNFLSEFSLFSAISLFAGLSLGFGLVTLGITYLIKQLFIGKYESIQRPLWSHFVWRTEFVTAIYESLTVPFFISFLTGTPFVNWALRSLGCKIGKRVFTNTTDITEFDLVQIGDNVALNLGCDLQTHLFEDRVMKVSHISIGNHCNVGGLSVVLYDTKMENNTTLGSLSLLMKGETLPSNTQWSGSPARPENNLMV